MDAVRASREVEVVGSRSLHTLFLGLLLLLLHRLVRSRISCDLRQQTGDSRSATPTVLSRQHLLGLSEQVAGIVGGGCGRASERDATCTGSGGIHLRPVVTRREVRDGLVGDICAQHREIGARISDGPSHSPSDARALLLLLAPPSSVWLLLK